MKIYVNCKSLLLQRSLEIFLKSRLSTLGAADIVVSDYDFNTQKPLLFIGNGKKSSIKIPFSKAKILTTLEKMYEIRQAELLVKDGTDEFEEELNLALSEFSKKIKRIFAKKLYESINQHTR
jgi:hypothetical protein